MSFVSQWPGSGDYFHFLHHAHFDCNYGSPHVPLDWLFGTYAGNKAEVRHHKRPNSWYIVDNSRLYPPVSN
jgi:sterol desaturase/sphingolipid hydroxylase (fatty acid hydroxylase superfamily)